MLKTIGYAAKEKGQALTPFHFERRDIRPQDIAIDILYCGVCHSDLHQVNDDWTGAIYPMVPGHEIIGRVSELGSAVTTFKEGQLVGVGCMVDSCQQCTSCKEDEEQFCQQGASFTYNAEDKVSGGPLHGGYSKHIVVDKDFVLSVDEALSPAHAAPLLCAGITTYSPLKRVGIKKGSQVGIAGLGGLGHMAVKIALAMGAEVTVLTHSPNKVDDAKSLGAHHVIVSSDQAQMSAAANSFDFILNTVSAQHDINAYLNLLKHDATLTQVGLPSEPLNVSLFPLVMKRVNFTGSLIGGIRETQEMLDFCAAHNITADIEVIEMDKINEAFTRLEKGEVKYRFVIDMASLKV